MGGGRIAPRLTLLVEALAPAPLVARAHDLRGEEGLRLRVAHTPDGFEVEGSGQAGGTAWRAGFSWRLTPAALRLRAVGPVPGAPAVPSLLPDVGVRTRCDCGRAQPCIHALALILALAPALEAKPDLLRRPGEAEVGPAGPAPAPPPPPASSRDPAAAFWSFTPPAPVPPPAPEGPPARALVGGLAESRPELARELEALWRRLRERICDPRRTT